MKREEAEILAAEYALGTLGAEERGRLENAMAADNAVRALVEQWQHRLTALRDAEETTPPPAVWDRIDSALDVELALPGTQTVRDTEGAWVDIAPGVKMKLLQSDPASGARSLFLRLAPGARLNAHDHASIPEECVVIEGDMIIGGERFTAGDYHLARAGSRHPSITSEGGGLLFIRGALAA